MAEYLEKIVRNDGYQCGPEYHIQNSSNSSANRLETAESIEKSSTSNPHFPSPTMVPNEDYTSEFIVASFDLDMTQSVCGYPHCSPGKPLLYHKDKISSNLKCSNDCSRINKLCFQCKFFRFQ